MASLLSRSSFLAFSILSFSAALAACQFEVVDMNGKDARAQQQSQNGEPGQSAGTTTPPSSGNVEDCEVEVDRFKELIVIHRSVLQDRRAQNDVADAPWSFRSRMEELAGGTDTSGDSSAQSATAFTLAWLDQWKTLTAVGPDYAPVTPRPKIDSVLLDPWKAKGGAAETMPFRLIAIVNRPDLREKEDGCEGFGGELRFVYSAVDAETKKALGMTVIVEIPYPTTRTAREWIDAWHALGAKSFGADYNDTLAALTTETTKNSAHENWRVRTNEIALAEGSMPWEMRDFALTSTSSPYRMLAQAPITTTPRIDLDRTPSLDSWAEDNRAKIFDGSYVLPGGMQAGAAPIASASFRWSSREMNEDLRAKLSAQTCNGCHGGERTPSETTLPFQHIAAADQSTAYYGSSANGETRLSRWLHDPSSNEDELGRREKSMKLALCKVTTCKTPPPPPSSNPGSGYGDGKQFRMKHR